MAQNPIVTITMESGDVIKLELYPEIAPQSVNNFISLVNKNFYDGLIFHRVIRGFMIQGGCPDGTGMGGPGYSIKGEFAQNGFANDLKHTEGVYGNGFHHLLVQRSVLIIGRSFSDFVHNLHTFNDFTKGCIAAIQMRRVLVHNKELASCGVGHHASGHGKNALGML